MHITDKSVTDYINTKYKPVSDILIPFRRVGEHDKVPIILKETETVLSMLLDLTHPAKILEIGTAIGYSAAFFAFSCPEAVIYTVEKDEGAFRAANSNIRNAGVQDRVNIFLGDGEEVTRELVDKGIKDFDFIFIDAAKSHYRRFLDAALTAAGDEALIVSDNILQHGMTADFAYDPKNKHKTNIQSMRSYIDYLMRCRNFRTTLLSTGDGLAVTKYRRYI